MLSPGGGADAGVRNGTGRSSSWTSGALQLFALSAFAVAQPILDVVSRNPTYLVAHGMSGPTIIAFVIGLIVVPPLVAAGFVAAVGVVSGRAAMLVRTLFIGVLFALAVCPPLTRRLSLPSGAVGLIYLAIAAGGAFAYARAPLVRRYLTWLSPAPVLFAIGFLVFGPASAFFSSSAAAPEPAAGANDTSVVHLVLDELSLGSLLKPDGNIDAKRFPNFARLAERSTWYRDATTNSNATRYAVPAALTGDFPIGGDRIPPTNAVYPHNLFSLLESSHRLKVEETVTSLCSLERCRARGLPTSAIKHLFADTLVVYLQGSMPPSIKAVLPPLPEAQWAGFFANPLSVGQRVARFPAFLRPLARAFFDALADQTDYSPEVRRFNSLITSIDASAQPTLWFHHALLPHQPWHLLEDATPYDDQHNRGFVNSHWASQAAADEAFQRYLLQLKGTDVLVGRLIDRLEREGRWNDTLLVVHADHGVTFTDRLYYRAILGAKGDLLRIPLFIKYPGQHRGRVDDRNAELVDILPTIADVLDVRPNWHVDGRSLLEPGERRLKRAWAAHGGATELPPMSDVERPRSTQRVFDLFGAARHRDDLYAFGPHRKLVGKRTSAVKRFPQAGGDVTIERPERYDRFDVDASFLPVRVVGRFHVGAPWVAVAVNGRIAGLGRPERTREGWHFAVMCSPRLFEDGRNTIDVFAISNDGRIGKI